jgi:copper(I)-binding protein
MKRTIFLFVVLMLVLAACGPSELTVSEAWARPGLAGNNSAIYFVVQNPGEDDTLLSVASNVAGAVEMHMTMAVEGDTAEHNMDHSMEGSDMGTLPEGQAMPEGQVMTMVKQENVPVPGGDKVAFEPGGLHIMLLGLNSDLVVGDTIEVTLTFEKAGAITLQVPVEEN